MDFKAKMHMESCRVDSLSLKTRIDGFERAKEQQSARSHTFRLNVRKHLHVNKFRIEFGITSEWEKDQNSTFSEISIDLDAVFSFSDDCEDEEIRRYVPTLCVSNLLGIARGMIAHATGVCTGGPYYVPLLNVNSIMEQILSEQTTTERKQLVSASRKDKPKSVPRKLKAKSGTKMLTRKKPVAKRKAATSIENRAPRKKKPKVTRKSKK